MNIAKVKNFTMYRFIKNYEFKTPPKEISYENGEPLELSNQFSFYHNKNLFRKELNRLQYLFKQYTGDSLVAAGIRDSYLEEKYTENFLIILFTTNDIIKNANEIIKNFTIKSYDPGSFYLKSTSKYILLITKDMKGLISGIDVLEDIFTQTFEDYIKQEAFEDFVKIRPFSLYISSVD